MPGLQNSNSTLQFLGTIGTVDKGDVLPLNDTAKSLVKLAGFLIQKASDNMQKKRNVATGDTISSMKIVNLDLSGERKSLDVEILSTYKFLDEGVRGVKGGTGKYSFKSLGVGKKMHKAILDWLKIRGRRGAVAIVRRPYGKLEIKDRQIAKKVNKGDDLKRLAYAVGTAVKRDGIRPTKFWTNAVRDTNKQAKRIIGEGFRADIINSIKESQLK